MKKLLFFLLLVFGFQVTFADAVQAEVYFKEANLLYHKGEYQQAADLYQQIEGLNVEAAEVYYNLGNCFFKMGQLPQAIYNYEKANARAPFDEKIQTNLAVAYANTTDKIEYKPSNGWLAFVKAKMVSYENFLNGFTIVLAFILLTFIILYKYKNNQGYKKPIVVTLVLFVGFFVLSFIQKQVKNPEVGVVFSSETLMLTKDKKQTIRKIHEGTKVYIEQTSGNYFLVHLSDFSKGLVKKEAIKKVD